MFMTYFSCDPERAEANLKIVADVLGRARARRRDGGRAGPGQEQDQLAAWSWAANARAAGCSPSARTGSTGEYRTVQDDLDAIDAVTRDDIAAVLRKYPLTAERRWRSDRCESSAQVG